MEKVFKFIFCILILVLFANLVFLDVWFVRFKDENESQLNKISEAFKRLKDETEATLSYRSDFLTKNETDSLKITPTTVPYKGNDICPSSCQDQIDTLSKTALRAVTPSPLVLSPTPQNNFVREIYVPLGGATTLKTTSYKTTGAMAYVDLSKYGQVKTVYFEAVLSIPTANGTVYARLINVTDSNTPVAGSEVSTFASTPSLLVSSPINLAYGNKLYAVQLRTTMDFESVLEIARLRIQLL
jgi:hypothetical protein